MARCGTTTTTRNAWISDPSYRLGARYWTALDPTEGGASQMAG